MVWAKFENGAVTAISATVPPIPENGEVETGWKELAADDPAIPLYYQQLTRAVEPEAVQQPLWDEFRMRLDANPTYKRIVLGSFENASFHYPAIVALMWQLGTNPQLMGEVAMKWNAMIDNTIPSLTADEIQALNQIGLDTHLPFYLGNDGKIPLG